VDIYSLDYTGINHYSTWSGSSFSTAIVSGIAAILIEKYEHLSLGHIENILKKNTIKLRGFDEFSQGNGELSFVHPKI
jgi:subtilisin family serine protease